MERPIYSVRDIEHDALAQSEPAASTVRLLLSVALASTREALHNAWDKNDSQDANVILHMLRIAPASAFVTHSLTGSTICRSAGPQGV